jgi:hypothetical protein
MSVPYYCLFKNTALIRLGVKNPFKIKALEGVWWKDSPP